MSITKWIKGIIIIVLVNLTFGGCNGKPSSQKQVKSTKMQPARNLAFARRQLRQALKTSYKPTLGYPRSAEGGYVRWVSSDDWTSGFFPAELWSMYQYTGKSYWKKQAIKWTKGLKKQQYNTGTHDVGFMMYGSYGKGYQLTHNPKYKKIVLQSARSLASRFRPKVGAIKSWDNTKWQYPVIIDNLMNLKLLFVATKISGDSTFYRIARRHALTTLKHQFRPDGGSYHVVNFDPTTGTVLWRGTRQGYADSSTWARGESWGLYGLTMAYHYTHDKRFLKQARKVAHFILTNDHLPDDDIPYWDYDAPNIPHAPRDVSAAAIMSSAFLGLSHYVHAKDSVRYTKAAGKILNALSHPPYRAKKVGTNSGFILRKSVGNKPAHSEVDVPLVYADYYYIQANIRYSQLMNHH